MWHFSKGWDKWKHWLTFGGPQMAPVLPVSDQRVCLGLSAVPLKRRKALSRPLVQCFPKCREPSTDRTGCYLSLSMHVIITLNQRERGNSLFGSQALLLTTSRKISVLCWDVSQTSSNSCQFLFLTKKETSRIRPFSRQYHLASICWYCFITVLIFMIGFHLWQ